MSDRLNVPDTPPGCGLQVRSLWLPLGATGLGLPALAFGLAWLSSGFIGVPAWAGFLGALALAAGLLLVCWLALRSERLPGWLLGLTILAALLRLAAGVTWHLALPVGGYNSPAELSGYVMADAYERDRAAWDLGVSSKPLARAFQGGYRKADQYGGLLYLSALVYRTLGEPSRHTPLLMVVFSAFVSGLAVLFAYAWARRTWDGGVAAVTAWGLALYPEAVLLGSSQMREAFLVAFVAVAFYGLAGLVQGGRWKHLVWILLGLGASLFFSPPFTALLVLLLGLQAAAHFGLSGLGRGAARRTPLLWLVLVGLGLLALAGLWLSARSLAPEGIKSPLELIGWWLRRSASYQLYLNERLSGWFQKIFDATPEWSHIPLLVGYGIFQPFLPAAISDVTGALIWRTIAVWRSVGWTLMLPFLLYAPLSALQKRGQRRWPVLMLSLLVWVVILVASYRSAGDQWDNPRYRAAFAVLQIGLAAWTLVSWRREGSVWLQRAVVGLALVILWFLPWYLRRYIFLPWPVEDPFKVLGLGLASAFLYALADWARRGGESPPTRR